jgi:geranylgeranyl pyrophosphate synthase
MSLKRIVKFYSKGLDIYWRDNVLCPTEEEYLFMIDCKTSALFGLGVKLMQLMSDVNTDYMTFVRLIGQYFQIRDDYMNLKSEEVSI